MKTTDYFKQTIQTYLENRAATDELFAARYTNPKKNIDDCTTYILNEVRASGCNGFADEEIYSMALHYYDEPDIEVGKSVNCRVVVNHTIDLTEEEKAQARRDAMKRAEQEAHAKLTQRKPAAKKQSDNNRQMNLLF
ncbi:MAG: PcfK-like family protein [Alistipes senegalensis]|nr:PcfK-like family protein [Bacteroides cellulosilyticus]MCM1352946.1 PcfK-like family protein [Alistipes senegalensis]